MNMYRIEQELTLKLNEARNQEQRESRISYVVYHALYNNDSYLEATKGMTVEEANLLIDYTLAACGNPFYKNLPVKEWTGAAQAHIDNFRIEWKHRNLLEWSPISPGDVLFNTFDNTGAMALLLDVGHYTSMFHDYRIVSRLRGDDIAIWTR